MVFSILLCLVSFGALLVILRWRGTCDSLGIPAAYMLMLLMVHIPGAIVHALPWSQLEGSEFVEIGIRLTAIGAVSFVLGVWLARLKVVPSQSIVKLGTSQDFWAFSLVLGWFIVYVIGALLRIASITAVVEKGGAIWMLGAMLALRASIGKDAIQTVVWLGVMLVYPIVMLLIGGFLGYGFATIMICLSILAISTRARWRVVTGVALATLLGFNLFLSYFHNRDELRSVVWGEAPMESRLDAAAEMFRDLKWFDPHDPLDLAAVDARLNQNYFVGLAASRIDNGDVEPLRGHSIVEGLIALVPRIIWPSKPVTAGSPGIVMEMTGLWLSDTTSWGVGQVMEFYINWGTPSLILGFVAFGWLIARLDYHAAVAEQEGNIPKLLRCFLPAVAMVGPQWSIVELASGAAAAFVAAFVWAAAWQIWNRQFGFASNNSAPSGGVPTF